MSQQVTTISRNVRVVEYQKTRLSVISGPDAGLSLEIAGGAVRIGTAEENDLILTDTTVSRRHCEVIPTSNGIRIRDSGSTNLVVVGGALVVDATFTAPIQIELGDTIITITPLLETVYREQLDTDRFGDLLGKAPPMQELFADLERIAPTELSLLIEGETGTGKELVAESVHRASARADGPFITFDCSSVAPTLAESELFGHERGAFTGAVNARAGIFEQAQGGTIFLDELGELPKDLQPKLLRVLEKREVRRIGGTRTIPIDVRLIAATNRNLRAEVQRGSFREDLYFRVAGARVYIPPLRERMSDLPRLIGSFLAASHPPRTLNEVPQHLWEMLRSYRWPGNVRELRNAVQRMLVTPDRVLEPEAESAGAPPAAPEEFSPLRVARREAADAFERRYVQSLLVRADGNITRAAALAEVSRQVIHALISKHAL
ncbi:MAG TPA: sigma 54-interacting transcriptional regulator [Polyangiaceae bacterium]|jgi:transcriptional regulator with PAS, ATPase and Fis domain